METVPSRPSVRRPATCSARRLHDRRDVDVGRRDRSEYGAVHARRRDFRAAAARDPHRGTGVDHTVDSRGGHAVMLSYPDFRRLSRFDATSSRSAAAIGHVDFSLSSGGEPGSRAAERSSAATIFRTLGVRMALGRGFLPDEDSHGAANSPVAVISYRLWQERFGGDPGVVGERVVIDGQPFTDRRRHTRAVQRHRARGAARHLGSDVDAGTRTAAALRIFSTSRTLGGSTASAGSRQASRSKQPNAAVATVAARIAKPIQRGHASLVTARAIRSAAALTPNDGNDVVPDRGSRGRGDAAGSADRLREREQPAARPRGRASPRDRGAPFARRGAVARRAPTAHRKRAAGAGRGRGRVSHCDSGRPISHRVDHSGADRSVAGPLVFVVHRRGRASRPASGSASCRR